MTYIEDRERRLTATTAMIHSIMEKHGAHAVVRMSEDRETEMNRRELTLLAIVHGRAVHVRNPQQQKETKAIRGTALVLQRNGDEPDEPGNLVILPEHGFTSPGGSTLIMTVDESREILPEEVYDQVLLSIQRNLERKRARVTFPKSAVVYTHK